MIRTILASGSPRRKEILERVGISFEVLVSEADESHGKEEPSDIVRELAGRKAEAVFRELSKERNRQLPCILIAADTLVAMGKQVYGKPRDREDAVRMLRQLQGKTHQVYTGVCILGVSGESLPGAETAEGVAGQTYSVFRDNFAEAADVHVMDMSVEEIREYVATGEPDDKAGAYAIQGIFRKYISGFTGDFETIKGLPGDAVLTHYREMEKKLKNGSYKEVYV